MQVAGAAQVLTGGLSVGLSGVVDEEDSQSVSSLEGAQVSQQGGDLSGGVFVVTAVYILRLLAKVFFGPLGEQWQDQTDATARERFSAIVLIGVVVLVGVFPLPFIRVINVGVAEMLARVSGA